MDNLCQSIDKQLQITECDDMQAQEQAQTRYVYVCKCGLQMQSSYNHIYKNNETNEYFMSDTEPKLTYDFDSSFRYFVSIPYYTTNINILRQLNAEEVNYMLSNNITN